MTERWVEETFHDDWRVALKADEIVHEVKSDHHHLVIFKNSEWGTVMMLDGVCQFSTRDEFVYHEMMAHVPLLAQAAKPKNVLIIGGGDGGVLREVLKHNDVDRVTLVDIDRTVIDLTLKYVPEIPGGAFDDPRTNVVIGDGMEFIAGTQENYDAIIVDSSEPIGPSAVLHSRKFFAHCFRAIKESGVVVAQNGLSLLFPDHLAGTTRVFASLFKCVSPYLCHQPCYFGGTLAINLGSDDTFVPNVETATLRRRAKNRGVGDLKYWTPETQAAAYALPAVTAEVVKNAIEEGRRLGENAKGYGE